MINKANDLPSVFIISLDFELHWGVSEKVAGETHSYNENLHGAREVIPKLLELFEEHNIHATWATVGALFAYGKNDFDLFIPADKPKYENPKVDNYNLELGESESVDPLHFAPSILEQIIGTSGQEISSHTFSHYFCGEAGQNKCSFDHDLKAAIKIANRDSIDLKSLVFPRNQVKQDYLDLLPVNGFDSYRGNPLNGLHDEFANHFVNQIKRVIRLLDSYLNVTGANTFSWNDILSEYPYNVKASHFLRPYSNKLQVIEPLKVRRVVKSLRKAAKKNEIYHLWWHPHNFGKDQAANLKALSEILTEFSKLRDQYGMRSMSMSEVADVADKIDE